ncbi:hypothetical protein [Kitasatospora sp. SolWspMP-SS2h]|uniref:hypothetical protein n=1 Tax=Kitasatospora sp. SolWspMP-SS2h TaxID=1305729 RepID=UPI001313EE18|nr:hypothetical protein [Kitasatospora sp. SolWspMP-SS2h]
MLAEHGPSPTCAGPVEYAPRQDHQDRQDRLDAAAALRSFPLAQDPFRPARNML